MSATIGDFMRQATRSQVRAVLLRAEPSAAEKALWKLLRDRQLAGAKFRRQHPIDPFVVDFACVEAKLIVEVDGLNHALEEQRVFDTNRTAHLESAGWPMLRVSNDQVLSDPSGVTIAIAQALARPPHPTPLPLSGERA